MKKNNNIAKEIGEYEKLIIDAIKDLEKENHNIKKEIQIKEIILNELNNKLENNSNY